MFIRRVFGVTVSEKLLKAVGENNNAGKVKIKLITIRYCLIKNIPHGSWVITLISGSVSTWSMGFRLIMCIMWPSYHMACVVTPHLPHIYYSLSNGMDGIAPLCRGSRQNIVISDVVLWRSTGRLLFKTQMGSHKGAIHASLCGV